MAELQIFNIKSPKKELSFGTFFIGKKWFEKLNIASKVFFSQSGSKQMLTRPAEKSGWNLDGISRKSRRDFPEISRKFQKVRRRPGPALAGTPSLEGKSVSNAFPFFAEKTPWKKNVALSFSLFLSHPSCFLRLPLLIRQFPRGYNPPNFRFFPLEGPGYVFARVFSLHAKFFFPFFIQLCPSTRFGHPKLFSFLSVIIIFTLSVLPFYLYVPSNALFIVFTHYFLFPSYIIGDLTRVEWSLWTADSPQKRLSFYFI